VAIIPPVGLAVAAVDRYHMPTVSTAFSFLESECMAILPNVRSMLYVGHRSDTSPWWRTSFWEALGRPELGVIDIQPANLQSADGLASRLVHGDIRTFDAGGFDLVFWDEGPEHACREEALATCARLSLSSQVLVSCPWGYQPQGSGPSDYEFHHWGPEPSDFQSIGMEARCFGTHFDGVGGGHGNLIAWSPAPQGT
jgi:hypothetical protein